MSFIKRLIATLAVTGALLAPVVAQTFTPKHQAVVKLDTDIGHGTAVHIGQGVFLTAAHVLEGATEVYVKIEDTTYDAKVLQADKATDVAFIRIDALRSQAASKTLECRTPTVGEPVEAHGYPLDLEDVRTFGRVSTIMRPHGFWRDAVIVDITIAPGMSGGPVYSSKGNVIGMAVGVKQFGGALVPLSVIVPGSTICAVLAQV